MKYQGRKVSLSDWIFLHYMDLPKLIHLVPWLALGWYVGESKGALVTMLAALLVILLVGKMQIDLDRRIDNEQDKADKVSDH